MNPPPMAAMPMQPMPPMHAAHAAHAAPTAPMAHVAPVAATSSSDDVFAGNHGGCDAFAGASQRESTRVALSQGVKSVFLSSFCRSCNLMKLQMFDAHFHVSIFEHSEGDIVIPWVCLRCFMLFMLMFA